MTIEAEQIEILARRVSALEAAAPGARATWEELSPAAPDDKRALRALERIAADVKRQREVTDLLLEVVIVTACLAGLYYAFRNWRAALDELARLAPQ